MEPRMAIVAKAAAEFDGSLELQKMTNKRASINQALHDAGHARSVEDRELAGLEVPSKSRAAVVAVLASGYDAEGPAVAKLCNRSGWVNSGLRDMHLTELSAAERGLVDDPAHYEALRMLLLSDGGSEQVLVLTDAGADVGKIARAAVVEAIALTYHEQSPAIRDRTSLVDWVNSALQSLNQPELTAAEISALPGPQ